MDSLARLFGSLTRAKLLRLFIFNESVHFSATEVATRAKLTPEAARHELAGLLAAGVIRKYPGKEVRYGVDQRYTHFEALAQFLRATDGVQGKRVLKALGKAGAVKLVTLSGFLSGNVESSLDLLVVGDELSERMLARAIAELEAELGREIRYAAFTVGDFRYRLGVYDRLVRDVFDYPHQVLLDRLGL